MDDHHLTIDNRLAGNIQGAGDDRESLGPVQPVAGVDLLLPLGDVDLDPVAVVLDLMEPLIALGSLRPQLASWGLMNPGISEGLSLQSCGTKAAPGYAQPCKTQVRMNQQ